MRLDRTVETEAVKSRIRLVRRRDIDWKAVERDYRVGILSLRQLAERHGCSHSAIANRATAAGWRRERFLEG